MLDELCRLFLPVLGGGIILTIVVGGIAHWIPIILAILAVAWLISIVGM